MTSTRYDRRWKSKVEDILQLQREQDKCKFAVAVCKCANLVYDPLSSGLLDTTVLPHPHALSPSVWPQWKRIWRTART